MYDQDNPISVPKVEDAIVLPPSVPAAVGLHRLHLAALDRALEVAQNEGGDA
jgi:hypothetical protein